MNTRLIWGVAVLLAALGTVSVAPRTALAESTQESASGPAVGIRPDAAAERELVLWIAQTDSRAQVRAAAWGALLNRDGDVAIRRFLDLEYAFAEKMAAESQARSDDFVAHVLSTCVPEYSPRVCEAAEKASRGDDDDRAAFASEGYAVAEKLDREARNSAGAHAAALRRRDRDFVAGLRDGDPGANVRAAAGWALRVDGGDRDLVEFFVHDWGRAAELDVQGFRASLTDREVAWLGTTRRLVAEAQAADAAARGLAGEAAAQARAAAGRAWTAVREAAAPARTAWGQAEQTAIAQARSWQEIAATAAASESPNWKPIAGTAEKMREQWAAEQQLSASRSAYWADLHQTASARERALGFPPS